MKPDPLRNFDWGMLVVALLVLLACCNAARADTSITVFHDSATGNTITITTITTLTHPSIAFPTYYGSVVTTVHIHLDSPAQPPCEFDYTINGGNYQLGLPGVDENPDDPNRGLYYGFSPDVYLSNQSPANQGWSVNPNYTLQGSGGNVTPDNSQYHTLTGAQTDMLVVSLGGGDIPPQFLIGGKARVAVVQDGTVIQEVIVTPGSDSLSVSVNSTSQDPVQFGLEVPGYKNDPNGGLQQTGNASDMGYYYVPITQGNFTGGTASLADNANISLNLTAGEFAAVPTAPTSTNSSVTNPAVPTPTVSTGGFIPIWTNPAALNATYTPSSDPMTQSAYKQGVTNQMNQLAAFQSQEAMMGNQSNTLLQQIANNTANLSGGNFTGGGNTSGNDTGDTSGNTGNTTGDTTNIESWAQRGNDAAGNDSAFTRGTDPDENAANESNMSATWSGSFNGIGVSSTIPAADVPSANASSVFQIALPAAFGGGVIDFNPFRSDRLGPVLSGFRTALAWLAVVSFAIWALRETFAVIKDSGKLSQVVGPKVIVAGESDGGLVVAGTYILLTAAAVAVLLAACVAIYDTNWPILGQFAALFTIGPFHSFPAQAAWMLDQVFPVATCVAALLGRLTYIKLLALAYVVYMAFYKSKPA